MNKKLAFQDIINKLQEYWANLGCSILQPYDMEMGAGTFHPATALMTLGKKPIKAVYVQPSRRPTDGRYGDNPNRLYHFHQLQTLLKPSPENVVELYLDSLKYINIDPVKHDIRFVEDDWESPTLGASGLGWEVWCDGMEVSQFTYMQQIGAYELNPVTVEITYGLERIAMFQQDCDNVYDLIYNYDNEGNVAFYYKDFFKQYEHDMSAYCLDLANTEFLLNNFNQCEQEIQTLIKYKLPLAAYEQCIKASNYFNLLDARGVIGVNERVHYIARVRQMARMCTELYFETNN
jgi:glycyl-tRNA synthetase alpha chain